MCVRACFFLCFFPFIPAEELKLLLDSSGDDFDFLVPTILDGSSTGLEGASGGTSSSPEACGSTLEVRH